MNYYIKHWETAFFCPQIHKILLKRKLFEGFKSRYNISMQTLIWLIENHPQSPSVSTLHTHQLFYTLILITFSPDTCHVSLLSSASLLSLYCLISKIIHKNLQSQIKNKSILLYSVILSDLFLCRPVLSRLWAGCVAEVSLRHLSGTGSRYSLSLILIQPVPSRKTSKTCYSSTQTATDCSVHISERFQLNLPFSPEDVFKWGESFADKFGKMQRITIITMPFKAIKPYCHFIIFFPWNT